MKSGETRAESIASRIMFDSKTIGSPSNPIFVIAVH